MSADSAESCPADQRPPVQPTATRYEFRPSAMFEGAAADSAHLYDSDAIIVAWRGGATWAVMRGDWTPGTVWNGESWEHELSASSRTPEFLTRCRFELDEALSIAAWLTDPAADGGAHHV